MISANLWKSKHRRCSFDLRSKIKRLTSGCDYSDRLNKLHKFSSSSAVVIGDEAGDVHVVDLSRCNCLSWDKQRVWLLLLTNALVICFAIALSMLAGRIRCCSWLSCRVVERVTWWSGQSQSHILFFVWSREFYFRWHAYLFITYFIHREKKLKMRGKLLKRKRKKRGR